MKRYFNYLLFISLFLLISCDAFETSHSALETKNVYVVSETAIVINLATDIYLKNAASINITQTPSKGTIKLLPSGQVIYIPDQGIIEDLDVFQYTTSTQTESQEVTIHIVETASALPYQHDIFADIIHIDPELAQRSTNIHVLSNDVFDENDIDISSLEVITKPSYGSVSISPYGHITYTSTNVPHYVDYDFFVYKIKSDAQTPEVGYAPVIIYFGGFKPCSGIYANDDFISLTNSSKGESITFNTLDNDIYCKGAWNSLGGYVYASHGNLVKNRKGVYTYTAEPGYHGKDMFTYYLCDSPEKNNCSKATVHLDISYQGPKICMSQVTNDEIKINISTAKNRITHLTKTEKNKLQLKGNELVVALDVKANDQICANDRIEFTQPIQTNKGRIVQLRNQLYYIHAPAFFGKISASYAVCTHKTTYCKEASIHLNIQP